MSKISMHGKGDIEQISGLLTDKILSSGVSCELVDSSVRISGNNSVILLVFEKYYMRASNRASLTVMLCQNEDIIYVDAIGSGGGQGPIFKFSWGTEESFVNVVADILSNNGFS